VGVAGADSRGLEVKPENEVLKAAVVAGAEGAFSSALATRELLAKDGETILVERPMETMTITDRLRRGGIKQR
jgi:hypothetical protein